MKDLSMWLVLEVASWIAMPVTPLLVPGATVGPASNVSHEKCACSPRGVRHCERGCFMK